MSSRPAFDQPARSITCAPIRGWKWLVSDDFALAPHSARLEFLPAPILRSLAGGDALALKGLRPVWLGEIIFSVVGLCNLLDSGKLARAERSRPGRPPRPESPTVPACETAGSRHSGVSVHPRS